MRLVGDLDFRSGRVTWLKARGREYKKVFDQRITADDEKLIIFLFVLFFSAGQFDRRRRTSRDLAMLDRTMIADRYRVS